MTSYAEAAAILRRAARPSGVEVLPLGEAVGRVLAEDVPAPFPLPRFANSGMDGYAFRAAGTVPGTRLRVARVIAAGDAPGAELEPGGCVEIMTGAALPPGADCVLPVEEARREGDDLVLEKPGEAGRFIRREGEDLAAGGLAAGAGTRLSPGHVLPLAALGIARIAVRRRPRAAVLATGSELAASGGAAPGPGGIYDANGAYAGALLPLLGAQHIHAARCGDGEAEIRRGLAECLAAGAEVIVTTGGVSAGKFDAVPGALRKEGGEILFHRLAMKPGRPTLFAMLPGGVPVFGLPGNPASAAAGLRFLLYPLLCRTLGLPEEKPLAALPEEAPEPHPSLTLWLRCAAGIGEDGKLRARVLPGQDSFRMMPFSAMTGWLRLEPDGTCGYYPAIP
jgi:molybdopterin molybdotransferase